MRLAIVANCTRGTILAERAEVADSFWERGRGLLGREGLEPGTGLVLRPCNWVHSFFMSFACSLVYADRQGRVLRVVDRLAPNRMEPPVIRAHCVVELPPDAPSLSSTVPGDFIELRPLD